MIMDRQHHGLPVVNHLLQHTLRSICTESQWVYAVFWRILPRNYPPPKWDNDSGFLDRSKGNKRNWILTWEDGFCDFAACAKSAKSESDGGEEPLQPELFFKMSHEVYSYGEGLMGKVASDSSHKWIFKDPAEQDSSFVSPWHGSLDPHPRTWESQFKAGVQTIAIVAVQEGLLQLGSLEKVFEDLNLVILLQRKFTYLQSIPGVFAPHPNTLSHMRPRVPLTHHHHHHHHRSTGTTTTTTTTGYGILDDSLIGLSEQQRMNLIGLAGSRTTQQTVPTYHHQLHHHQDNNNSAKQFTDHNVNNQLVGLKRTCSLSDHQGEDDSQGFNNTNMGRNIPERPPLSKSLNTGHSPPGSVVSHLQPSMSSLHALLSKLPSVSPANETQPSSMSNHHHQQQQQSASPSSSSSSISAAAALSLTRSLSLPNNIDNRRPFSSILDHDLDQTTTTTTTTTATATLASSKLELNKNMQNLTCKTGSTGSTIPSTKLSISPDATTKGGSGALTMAKDRLSLYLEAFENVSDFGIQSELEAYNSFLSEIIN